MKDERMTKSELIRELKELRHQNAKLEELEANREHVEEERKRAEDALKNSEIRYRRLFETAKDGILILDAETGMVTDVNPFMIKMLGFSHEEFLGKKIWELGFFKDILRNKANFLELQQREYIRYKDLPLETADGRQINVEFVSNVYEVDHQKVIQCNIRDITVRKRTVEELKKHRDRLEKLVEERTVKLRESERYHRTIKQTALDGFWVNDMEGRILDVNDSYCRMIGYSREELLKMSIPDIEAVEKPEETAAHIKRVLERGYDRFETRQKRKDGEIIDLEVSATYSGEGGGQLVVFLRNITERKAAEVELERYTEQLEATNKELQAFSYSVSHDLRAPLRAIQGFAKILLNEQADRLDDEGLRYLNVISNSAKQMGNLIDDILAFSRLGRKEIRKTRIDMIQLAESVFADLKNAEPERSLQLNIKPVPEAKGDMTLIQQVLVNLLTNAVKFTRPREKAVIEIGAVEEKEENVYFIKDNGVGFDMKYVNKLFGVFQRLHTTGEFEGTGIGLALVQRLIHRHGGRVWAEGKPGEGAIFYFTLPKGGE